jgi:gamma-glutamyltranspeptidase/glutathione hydrolase
MLFVFLLFVNCSDNSDEKYFENGIIATATPMATDIGVQVFNSGGNAFDVAVAVGFALAVVYPEAGNIGGGGFAVIRYGKTGEIKALDFREKAPLAAHDKMFLDASGKVIDNLSTFGALAAGVPGTVAGLHELWKQHGAIPWRDLVLISVALADSGFLLDKYQADHFKEYQLPLSTFEETRSLFFPDGKALEPGERLKLHDLGRTLREIAEKGPPGFYQGDIADSIVTTMTEHGGIITLADLSSYTAVWRDPLKFSFDSLEIYSMPPPSSGGIIVGQILKLLEKQDFSKLSPKSTEYIHLFCESARLAYADRSQHLGDPDFYAIPDFLLKDEYISRRAALIDLNHANTSSAIQPGDIIRPESKQTTHFSVADKYGNVVSLTYTLNSSYGSKLAVRGCGFLLNNEMDDFAIAPGHPNIYGLVGDEANKVEPGKRMLSSMSPTIVMKGKQPVLILGSPGGSQIITAVAQTILNFTRFGLSLDEAVNYPRIHHQWLPDKIQIEENFFDINVKQDLIRLGHNIEEFKPITDIQAVAVLETGKLMGVSDNRGTGASTGF